LVAEDGRLMKEAGRSRGKHRKRTACVVKAKTETEKTRTYGRVGETQMNMKRKRGGKNGGGRKDKCSES